MLRTTSVVIIIFAMCYPYLAVLKHKVSLWFAVCITQNLHSV